MYFKAELLAGTLLLLFAAGVVLIAWSLPPDDLAAGGPIAYFHSIQIGSFVFDLPSFSSSNRTTSNTLVWIAAISAAVGALTLTYAWIRTYLRGRNTTVAAR